MKKYIFMALAACLAACSGAPTGSKDKGEDSEVNIKDYISDQTINEPLTVTATMLGYRACDEYKNQLYLDTTLSKDEYLRGFKYGLEAQVNSSFSMGMEHAKMFYLLLLDLKHDGVEPGVEQIYKAYSQAFLADDASSVDIQALELEASQKWGVFEDSLNAYHSAIINRTPEAKANAKRGTEYIDSLARQGWELTTSGIAYRIDSLAEGSKLTDKDRFYVTFTARSISGQKARSYQSRPMSLASFEEPGFAEVAQLAPIGSKVTAAVPGHLAFGTNAPYKVGVNEAIIIELRIDSLYTPPVPVER